MHSTLRVRLHDSFLLQLRMRIATCKSKSEILLSQYFHNNFKYNKLLGLLFMDKKIFNGQFKLEPTIFFFGSRTNNNLLFIIYFENIV